jgi:hypothetical protein
MKPRFGVHVCSPSDLPMYVGKTNKHINACNSLRLVFMDLLSKVDEKAGEDCSHDMTACMST